MPKNFLTRPWLRLTAAMLLAGVLYSSWPLGYWLNPTADRGLASNLEALHQPYNWVFIGLDIISGAIICAGTWWLLRVVRRHRHKPDGKWLEMAVVGLGVFGLLTALDAILPLNCISTTQHCLPPLEDPYFVIHGVASTGSVAGLTLSLFAIWWLVARDQRIVHAIRWLLHGLLAIWLCFGAGTAVLVFRDRSSNLSQHVFILFCSLWVALVPFFIWQVLNIRPHFKHRYLRQFNRSKNSRRSIRLARSRSGA